MLSMREKGGKKEVAFERKKEAKSKLTEGRLIGKRERKPVTTKENESNVIFQM